MDAGCTQSVAGGLAYCWGYGEYRTKRQTDSGEIMSDFEGFFLCSWGGWEEDLS